MIFRSIRCCLARASLSIDHPATTDEWYGASSCHYLRCLELATQLALRQARSIKTLACSAHHGQASVNSASEYEKTNIQDNTCKSQALTPLGSKYMRVLHAASQLQGASKLLHYLAAPQGRQSQLAFGRPTRYGSDLLVLRATLNGLIKRAKRQSSECLWRKACLALCLINDNPAISLICCTPASDHAKSTQESHTACSKKHKNVSNSTQHSAKIAGQATFKLSKGRSRYQVQEQHELQVVYLCELKLMVADVLVYV
eukprot:6174165-Pleurochrysis_carterae.AAC.3